ncbi:hypothetical protein N7478_009927 [Penicillium angulare]|uniref:uncharacterized protein n=1 Tax=Penicillium angulare TaxID=116970 RepID=UPI00254116C9|nr:uncharacterized protein N7478_009927 [Penicillium angulare]KAJ5267119.1 hypothetical protein N7478_009927 [Penicillium angulare]
MSFKLTASRAPARYAKSSLRAPYITKSHDLGKRWSSACTWLTQTPETINPEDILSSIPTTHHQSNSNPVPLLLVTPSLAHWLDPTSPFLTEYIKKLYQNTNNKPDTIYAVAAVIDKIPNSTAKSQASLEEFEGLSSLIVGEANIKWKAAPPRRIGGPADEEPNFVVSVNDQSSAHAIGLRLANTVFINGKERTFLGMRWVASESGYILADSKSLASCVVTSTETNIHSTVALPLHPVTQRRKVITGMGNILRQLAKSNDGSSDEPMPASTELEKELPRYIDEHNIVDRRVSVWALVEKADNQVDSQSPSTQDRLTKSLRQGGKLHRVMSGGGGWGKKMGLLSLDPEIASPTTITQDQGIISLDQLFESDSAPDEPMETPPFFESGLIGEDLSHLSQVANPGDLIQFFVAVEPTASNGLTNEAARKYCFGVVSETEALEIPTNDVKEKLQLVENTFAAMSEKAIFYSQPVLQAGTAVESSTKLDIPGCRVILESGKP